MWCRKYRPNQATSIYHTMHTSKWPIRFDWWIMIDCGFLNCHMTTSEWRQNESRENQQKSELTINERSNKCSDSYTWLTCCMYWFICIWEYEWWRFEVESLIKKTSFSYSKQYDCVKSWNRSYWKCEIFITHTEMCIYMLYHCVYILCKFFLNNEKLLDWRNRNYKIQ